jgi:hypothetical protein
MRYELIQRLLWLRLGYSCETQRKWNSAVGSRYKRTDEARVDRKDIVRALVNCRLCELAIAF